MDAVAADLPMTQAGWTRMGMVASALRALARGLVSTLKISDIGAISTWRLHLLAMLPLYRTDILMRSCNRGAGHKKSESNEKRILTDFAVKEYTN